MKNFIFISFLLISIFLKGQEVINPYLDFSVPNVNSINLNSNSGHYFNFYYPANSAFNNYTGEYEILVNGLDKVWDAYYAQNGTGSLSYKIEVVSFPFTMDCAYDFPNGCADGGLERKMYMPDNLSYPFSPLTRKWGTGGALALETPYPGVFYNYGTTYPQTHQNLISTAFVGQAAVAQFLVPNLIFNA